MMFNFYCICLSHTHGICAIQMFIMIMIIMITIMIMIMVIMNDYPDLVNCRKTQQDTVEILRKATNQVTFFCYVIVWLNL